MKVTIKSRDDHRTTLECIASAREVDEALDIARAIFANTMGLGNKEGAALDQLVEERMGIKDLDFVVQENAIASLVPIAMDQKELAYAYPPKAKSLSGFRRGLEYCFSIDVKLQPTYELSSYDPVEITVLPFSVDETLVDAQFDELANQNTYYEPDDPRPIQAGDTCVISVESTESGQLVEDLSAEDRTYKVAQGLMPESFDEQLIGMSPGETKTFTYDGPNLNDPAHGARMTFEATVTIKSLQKELKPVIDDAWVTANMPQFGNVENMRSQIAEAVLLQTRERYEAYMRQKALLELAKRFEGSIDDDIFQYMHADLVQNIQNDLRRQGKTWDEFVETNGGTDELNMRLMMQARELLVRGYVLDAVYRHESLSIDDEDIKAACRALNPAVDPMLLRMQLEASGKGYPLRESAQRLKANQWVVDHAIVHESLEAS